MIYQIKAPLLPAYRFEWHPEVKKVYVIRLGFDATALGSNSETLRRRSVVS